MTRFPGAALAIAVGLVAAGGAVVAPQTVSAQSSVEEGKAIAFDRRKGNCMACHMMDDASLPGNIGPPLIAMKARFPDRARLREQIWDATKRNPQSMMPPFGEHGVLTSDEIEKVIDYILTL